MADVPDCRWPRGERCDCGQRLGGVGDVSHVLIDTDQALPTPDVGRCVTTTRNPDTGEFAFATLDTLAGYRREGITEALPFGIYCDVVEPGRVRVGDSADFA